MLPSEPTVQNRIVGFFLQKLKNVNAFVKYLEINIWRNGIITFMDVFKFRKFKTLSQKRRTKDGISRKDITELSG